MSKFGAYKLGADLAARIEARIVASVEHFTASGRTPIEALFWVSLTSLARFDDAFALDLGYGGSGGNLTDLRERNMAPGKLAGDDGPYVTMFEQVWVGEWPVDFMVATADIDGAHFAWLAIECDGHEFHERTKEQAARDRSRDRFLQEIGCTVFRFTGSELYRDPMRCADQVLRWCLRKFMESAP